MNSLLLLLVGLGLLYLSIIGLYKKKEKSVLSKESLIKVHKNGHGHRCYTEGLTHSEYRIVQLLANNLDHNQYFIFNNIILSSKNTETTQIDHIVVSRFGVFVIESKRYDGWIFANPNSKKWTQTFRNGKKYSLYNPILQNYCHLSAIKNELSFLGNRFFNVVVFSGNCEFKTGRLKDVLYEEELVDYIKSKQEIKLKEVELLVVIGKLSILCQVTDVTNDEHVKNLREYFEKVKTEDKKQLVSV